MTSREEFLTQVESERLSAEIDKVFIAGSNMDRATNISTFNLIDGLCWIEENI